MQKSVLFFGLAVVAAIVLVMGSVTYVLYNIDEVIRSEVEATASRAFKVDATLAEATMSLKTGEAKLIGFRIPNPPGFPNNIAVHVPQVTVNVDTSRAAGRTIAIDEIVLEQPRIVLQIVDGTANLTRLAESARALATQTQSETEASSIVQKIAVKRVTLQNGTLSFRAGDMGDKSIDVPLPDTRISEIGGKDGVLPGALSAPVFEAFLTAAERASRRLNVPGIDFKAIFGTPDQPATLNSSVETAQ